METRFYKYHALGNDYLVLNPSDLAGELDSFQIQRICHRNFGVGSDGILLGPLETKEGDFGLRIFNPDGSEAEKSGNGLRIFSRYLWDQGLVKDKPFTVMTPGGRVESTVQDRGRSVTVQMGQVSFDSTRIPVKGEPREVLNETMVLEGESSRFCAATVGNPHCVVLQRASVRRRSKTIGASDREGFQVSEPDERSVHESARSFQYSDRDLGTWSGLHPCFRKQQQRGCGCGSPARALRGSHHGPHAGRRTRHPHFRGFFCPDDRPGDENR